MVWGYDGSAAGGKSPQQGGFGKTNGFIKWPSESI
jgi:hypothetical protein